MTIRYAKLGAYPIGLLGLGVVLHAQDLVRIIVAELDIDSTGEVDLDYTDIDIAVEIIKDLNLELNVSTIHSIKEIELELGLTNSIRGNDLSLVAFPNRKNGQIEILAAVKESEIAFTPLSDDSIRDMEIVVSESSRMLESTIEIFANQKKAEMNVTPSISGTAGTISAASGRRTGAELTVVQEA